jgi:hypothetical protein
MTAKFDDYISQILEYYNADDNMQRVISLAISGKKVKLKKSRLLTDLEVSRQDAPDILQKLKKGNLIAMYQYPVNDPAIIIIFKNIQDVKTVITKFGPEALQGFVKY